MDKICNIIFHYTFYIMFIPAALFVKAKMLNTGIEKWNSSSFSQTKKLSTITNLVFVHLGHFRYFSAPGNETRINLLSVIFLRWRRKSRQKQEIFKCPVTRCKITVDSGVSWKNGGGYRDRVLLAKLNTNIFISILFAIKKSIPLFMKVNKVSRRYLLTLATSGF